MATGKNKRVSYTRTKKHVPQYHLNKALVCIWQHIF
ncbi:unnamed protein product [Urochloa humidicola]